MRNIDAIALTLGWGVIAAACLSVAAIIVIVLWWTFLATVSATADVIEVIRKKIPRSKWKSTYRQVWLNRFRYETAKGAWKAVKDAYHLPVVVKHKYQVFSKIPVDDS